MFVIRPVQERDLAGLLGLAEQTSFGLTTLPKDSGWLAGRIRDSEEALRRLPDQRPRGEAYLFVLEDTSTGRVLGTAGIVSKVGGFEPFYAYRIQTSVHESKMLGIRKEIRTLHLQREHDGPCEIVSMFLHPELRGRGLGRPLSLARFLFIAEHPWSFDEQVIAEMRGVLDDSGRSEFWDAIGRHFFDIDYPKADYLSLLNKRFIADLMPTHPIYIPLLPPAAQLVIGRVHPETEPALAILKEEGFAATGMVDIFEAGPIVGCRRDSLRLVRESTTARVVAVRDVIGAPGIHLVGTRGPGFRACQTTLTPEPDGGVGLPRDAAAALAVTVGDTVRWGSLRGQP